MQYWIAVEQRHIEAGKQGASDACPVYFACQDAGLPIYSAGKCQLRFRGLVPGAQERERGDTDTDGFLCVRVPVLMVRTPGFVERAMNAFDRGEGMRPFGFWLELVPDSGAPRDEYLAVVS